MQKQKPVDIELRRAVFERLRARKLFWSYDVTDAESIPDGLFLETILIHGDLPDLAALPYLFTEDEIKEKVNTLSDERPWLSKQIRFASQFLFENAVA